MDLLCIQISKLLLLTPSKSLEKYFSGKYHVKFEHFVIFFIDRFSCKNASPQKKSCPGPMLWITMMMMMVVGFWRHYLSYTRNHDCKNYTGAISDVCHGRLATPHRTPVPVSLNVLHDLTSDSELREFLAVAGKMATLSSTNVEQLVGLVTTQTPYMIVTELPSNGSLLDFIRVRFAYIRRSFLHRGNFFTHLATISEADALLLPCFLLSLSANKMNERTNGIIIIIIIIRSD